MPSRGASERRPDGRSSGRPRSTCCAGPGSWRRGSLAVDALAHRLPVLGGPDAISLSICAKTWGRQWRVVYSLHRGCPAVKVLSLFTGAGGLDLGLEAAGFEIAGCVEVDSDARR